MKKLIKWIDTHLLDCTINKDGLIKFGEKLKMLYIPTPSNGKIFIEAEEGYKLNLHPGQEEADVEYYVFQFGSKFFYTPKAEIVNTKLTPFKYIRKALQDYSSAWPFLGIHGRYELMNGTRDYVDWCKKAKFLNMNVLGICEKHTLAGTLPFQKACKKNGIKPIIGGSYTVEHGNGERFELKFYAKDKQGWKNLLKIHKTVIIDNDGDCIDSVDLNGKTEGLVAVLKYGTYSLGTIIDCVNRYFDTAYYQLDPVEFEIDDRDRDHLERTKSYLRDGYMDIMPPVLINDAYYLEKEDQPIKEILNAAGSVKGEEIALDQYFKDLDENIYALEELFDEKDELLDQLVSVCVKNTIRIGRACNFEIDTETMHLPEYQMDDHEMDYYGGNLREMLEELLASGYQELVNIEEKDYTEDDVWNRVDHEVEVIVKGGYISYFLILWDICNWCRGKDILTGVGRGSAGGSMVAYLLGITKINPMDYGLLFERFLNEGRMKGSFPDIDTDFEGNRRDEVKRYMEEKYGKTMVASIGTYTTLQTKNAMKELARSYGSAGAATLGLMTSILDNTGSYEGIFKDALRKPKLKGFIEENPEVFEDIPLCLNSPKSPSVHPCATVIIPIEEKGEDIFDVLPMRKTEEGMLVTEWEGGILEDAGYLKEDILGIRQLDKLKMIFDLIKETTGDEIAMEEIPLDDPGTFQLFKDGHNADVFHFGSEGLSGYSYQVKPDSITDLINMNALFRPGPMGSGSHNKYVKLKNGLEEPEYDYGTEEVTKETFGLMIFQEQIMLICQKLGGFSLEQADDVRKGMGKKKMDILKEAGKKFVAGAVANGCPKVEADEIWEKMVSFGAYGFNKSHAAAYSITGYACNWLKCHYPMQFWVTALHFADDKKVPTFVSEIHKTGRIEIVPPAINESGLDFKADYKGEKIYWAINKIKFVGDAAVSLILNERETNGRFFSLEEFLERIEKKVAKEEIKPNPVNKRVLESLIVAGAFDEMEHLINPKERLDLLMKMYGLKKVKEKNHPTWLVTGATKTNWFWTLKQREMSGLGEMNFGKALQHTKMAFEGTYVSPEELYQESSVGKEVVVGGIIQNIRHANEARNSPAVITLQCNDDQINVKVWCSHWVGKDGPEDVPGLDGLRQAAEVGKIIFISGIVAKPWGPEQYNTVQSMGLFRNERSSKYHIL